MVLDTLSASANTNNGNLKIAFSKLQLVEIIDFTLQEVVAKPQWILEKLDAQPLLQTALGAALSSLNGIPIHQMNNDTRIIIMQSTLSAVAHNNALLNKVSTNGKMQSIASGAIDMTLSFVFGDKSTAKAQLGLVSGEAVGALTNAVLSKLALEGASPTLLGMINQFLEGELLGVQEGQPFSLDNLIKKLQSKESLQALLAASADQITRIAATALTEHPNLLQLHNTGVRTIVNSLAQSLAKFPDTINKAALGTISNTLLTYTAQHFSLVYKNGIANPSNNFLLESVETLLGALVQEDGNIRLAFNTLQLTDVTNFVVQQVIKKPNWVMIKLTGDNTMLQATLTTTLEVMTDSAFTGLNSESTAKILKSAMMAANTRIELLDRLSMTDNEKETVLSSALDFVLKTVAGDADILTNIDEMILPKIKWALSDNDTVSALADAVLMRIAAEGGDAKSLEMTKQLVVKEVTRIANGDNFSIKALINKLTSEENLVTILAGLLPQA